MESFFRLNRPQPPAKAGQRQNRPDRRQQHEQLRGGELQRAQQVSNQPRPVMRTREGIFERGKVMGDGPGHVREEHQSRNDDRQIGARPQPRPPRRRMQQHEQQHGRDEHDGAVLAHQSQPKRNAGGDPVAILPRFQGPEARLAAVGETNLRSDPLPAQNISCTVGPGAYDGPRLRRICSGKHRKAWLLDT